MSLHDLMAFAVLAHRCFDGVYKRAHWVMVQDLNLFPQVRYNKVVERLHRYEELLRECLGLFRQEGLRRVILVDWRNYTRYMVGSRRRGAEWVRRGLISALECFSCANKVGHRHSDGGVSVLCRDPCHYKPMGGERRLALDDIEETGKTHKG